MNPAQLLRAIADVQPALAGRLSGNGQARVRPDDALALQLLQFWQAAEPAAGRHFWSARAWTLLVWQPAWLSVLAVHLGPATLELDRLQQDVEAGLTGGFSIAPGAVHALPAELALAQAAGTLMHWQAQQHARLQAVQPFSARLAAALLLDCVHAALLQLQVACGWSNARLLQAGQQWRAALGLTAHGQLRLVSMAPGDPLPQRAMLDRRACCQYFRLPGAPLCSSCPRRPLAEREQLLRSEQTTATLAEA